MFTPDTLRLFANLLSQVRVAASDDDFEETARIVAQAKRELYAALVVESAT